MRGHSRIATTGSDAVKSPTSETKRPDLRVRLLIAAAVTIGAWGFATLKVRAAGPYYIAGDFTWHWRAADALLRVFSPYKVINTMPVYPFSGGYPYFLSTAAVMLPFGLLAPQVALPIFSGLSIGLLAFAFTRDGFWRLPLLVSLPVVWSTTAGQLTPLITAAMLVPALGWLAPVKFTIGAAGAAYNLSARYVVLAIAIVLLSVVIWPWWPREWWAELSDVPGRWYHVPVLIPAGFVLLLSLTRWRRPEARLLTAMACVPQTMLFYDQLPLALVAQSYRQALVFSIWSYAAPVVAIAIYGSGAVERGLLFARNAPIIVAIYYLPCLVIVLRRPNKGPVPRWLEGTAGILPRWLRGSPTPAVGPSDGIRDSTATSDATREPS